MILPRANWVFRLLLALWVLVFLWQALEHQRFKRSARETVIRRARDITGTLGLVIRSQRRFGGMVSKPRLESALNELVQSEELKGVVLLNAVGEVITAAGESVDLGAAGMPQSGVRWDRQSVTVVNLVDLGAIVPPDGTNASPTIVMPEPDPGRRDPRSRFPPPGPWPRRPETNSLSNVVASAEPGESRPSEAAPGPSGQLREPRDSHNPRPSPEPPGGPDSRQNRGSRSEPGQPSREPPGFWRPPWMNPDEYKALIEQKGLHGLAMVLSTSDYLSARTRDLWLRTIITGFAAIAAAGFAFAWRTLVKSSEYQMRLVRASEQNTHLREMNVAAAGLAHETRNPLNIIRGLAQMIAKSSDTPQTIRAKSLEITDEVDRVTVQLNEFINYSKPREVRRSPVALDAVVGDVVRALKSDIEDKSIQLEVVDAQLTVNADQPLLRQALFNLLLNAIQAVASSGQIQIVARKVLPAEANIDIHDNGPGVPPEQRAEIFRPYFTTRNQGTGLGLAVVKQIVLAHGWEVECLDRPGGGATFRLSRLELVLPRRS